MLKKCSGPDGCGLEKELNLTNFSKIERSKDGFNNVCRDCANIRKRRNRSKQTKEQKDNERKTSKIYKSKPEHQVRFMINSMRGSAKNSGMPFSLNKDDIILPKYCPVFDIEIQKFEIERNDNSLSVDRIDNKQGYIKDNIIIVSWKVNRIKNNASFKEMELLYLNYNSRNSFNVVDINHHLDSLYLKKRGAYKAFIVYDAKRRAKRKNIEFNITSNDIIIPKFCPILGIEIIKGEGFKCDNSPSIDRIDNTKGYVPDNVRVISFRANFLKNDSSYEEYEKIYFFYKEQFEKIYIRRIITVLNIEGFYQI